MQEKQLYNNWSSAWAQSSFRKKVIYTTILLLITALVAPLFFGYIEKRNGIVLNDWLLEQLPAKNFSIPIFTIIWGMFIYAAIKAWRSPDFFLLFITGYLLLNLSRFITIGLVPLNPPLGWVALKDPLTGIFYGNKIVTKDLFYSGHTSTMVLMAFCLPAKWEKIMAFSATLVIAVLLLFQKVHYTIDVIAAPFFAWMMYRASQKIILINTY
jgi:hypothetical protein